MTVAREIRLVGEVCPMTTVRTRLALDEMAPGEDLAVELDHLPAVAAVPAEMRARGHSVLGVVPLGGGRYRVVLRKSP